MVREIENQRNPILPLDIHIPDGEAHIMPDGDLYIFGSLDQRSDVFCSEEYRIVSTSDLKNWKIHDVALNGHDVTWFFDPNTPKYPGIDWENPTPFIKKMLSNQQNSADKQKFESVQKEPLLFAPDAIYHEGKYYLYFCMSDDSEGVAVSNYPQGPYKVAKQLPIGGIDPAVFIDDDKQAYFYWGQLYSHVAKLNDDMISLDMSSIQDNILTEQKHFFHEGTSIRKINGKYYLVYSSIAYGKPTSLSYAIGDNPTGPFKYGGVIINNEFCDPQSWNNHGSIECINGQWYVFYHRSSRNSQQHRRLCIEPITINEDGTIDEVKMTSQGVGQPFTLCEKIYGYQACELHGKCYIDIDDVYGEAIKEISEGDEIYFRYLNFENDAHFVDIECSGSASFELYLDNRLIGDVELNNGEVMKQRLCLSSGYFELRLRTVKANHFVLRSITFR